jgi:hypothetical protein
MRRNKCRRTQYTRCRKYGTRKSPRISNEEKSKKEREEMKN